MHDTPMQVGKMYLLQHTTQSIKAYVKKIQYKVDVNTLHREKTDDLALNEIGRVVIKTSRPIFFDPYKNNRKTGAFIIVNPDTNTTVGGGMIRGVSRSAEDIALEHKPATTTSKRSASESSPRFRLARGLSSTG